MAIYSSIEMKCVLRTKHGGKLKISYDLHACILLKRAGSTNCLLDCLEGLSEIYHTLMQPQQKVTRVLTPALSTGFLNGAKKKQYKKHEGIM